MTVEYVRPTRRPRKPPILDFLVLFLIVVGIWALGFVAGSVFSRSFYQAPAEPDQLIAEAMPVRMTAVQVKMPEIEPQPKLVSMGEFKITHYCPCPICCNEWADGITYTGTVATEGRTIAVDPDVIPLGSTVVIDGQEYIAEDIGGAIQGNRIDVFMDSHAAAWDAGVKYAEVFLYD